MKLSHQILLATAISLASVAAPPFVDTARHVDVVGKSVDLDAEENTRTPAEAAQGLETERPKMAPQTKSGLPTLTTNG